MIYNHIFVTEKYSGGNQRVSWSWSNTAVGEITYKAGRGMPPSPCVPNTMIGNSDV